MGINKYCGNCDSNSKLFAENDFLEYYKCEECGLITEKYKSTVIHNEYEFGEFFNGKYKAEYSYETESPLNEHNLYEINIIDELGYYILRLKGGYGEYGLKLDAVNNILKEFGFIMVMR